MTPDITKPAALWRRLIAAVYDSLILLGLFMAALLIESVIREAILGLPRSERGLQLYLFLVGMGFFCWFWIRGGQTLGMRAWKLKVRRLDGAPLRLPIAALRYTILLLTWMLTLTPLVLLLPRFADDAGVRGAALIGVLVAAASAALMMTESRRRAPCDWLAGTEVVQVPRNEDEHVPKQTS